MAVAPRVKFLVFDIAFSSSLACRTNLGRRADPYRDNLVPSSVAAWSGLQVCVNLALTVMFEVGVRLHFGFFLHPGTPFQRAKALPRFGLALSVMVVVLGTAALQVLPHLMPAALFTVPDPGPFFFTATVCRPSTLPALSASLAAAEMGVIWAGGGSVS